MLKFRSSWIRTLVGVCAFAATIGAPAQTSNEVAGYGVKTQLLLCAGRVTDSARLACYDGLAEGLRSAAPSETLASDEPAPAQTAPPSAPAVDPTTGVPVSAQAQPPEPRKPESFDLDVQKKQSIRVMIEKTKRNSRGDWYFYFDNNEVWKQIDSRTRRIPSLPAAATVSRGLFSSHKLHIDGQVWAMKVRRVK